MNLLPLKQYLPTQPHIGVVKSKWGNTCGNILCSAEISIAVLSSTAPVVNVFIAKNINTYFVWDILGLSTYSSVHLSVYNIRIFAPFFYFGCRFMFRNQVTKVVLGMLVRP